MNGCLKHINKRLRTNFKVEDIKGDIRDEDYWDDECEKLIRSPGFCYNLPIHEDLFDLPKRIMDLDERVLFVTSPYDTAPTWCYERTEWLKDHYGVDRDDIIFARSKQYVDGKFLIDDLYKNIISWESYNNRYSKTTPRGILVHRHWNRHENLPKEAQDYSFFRLKTIDGIVNYIKKNRNFI